MAKPTTDLTLEELLGIAEALQRLAPINGDNFTCENYNTICFGIHGHCYFFGHFCS